MFIRLGILALLSVSSLVLSAPELVSDDKSLTLYIDPFAGRNLAGLPIYKHLQVRLHALHLCLPGQRFHHALLCHPH